MGSASSTKKANAGYDETLLTGQTLSAIRHTPWKIQNELERLLVLPLARLRFALTGVRWGSGWKLYGIPIIQRHRQSRLTIGDYLNMRSTVRSNPLGPSHSVILSTRRPGAVLTIGDYFGMTGGVIVAEERIEIGDHVLIGANCTIVDTDFHPLEPYHRQQDPADAATAPIVIEDHVFIGMQSVVLKGVTIGAGSVIGACSVVTRDIPPGVIAAGNPARVIRELQRKIQ